MAKVRYATIAEQVGAPNGVPWIKKHYGITFGDMKTYDVGIRYRAVADGDADCVYAFGTDPQIADLNLVVLRDDKRIWPFDHVSPVVRKGFLGEVDASFPRVLARVNKLLDDKTMTALNARVDIEKEDPADVAEAFLKSKGIVSSGSCAHRQRSPPPRRGGARTCSSTASRRCTAVRRRPPWTSSRSRCPRGDLRPRRRVRLRQDDGAEDGQPPRRADERGDPARRRGRALAVRGRAAAAHRLRDPERRPAAAPDCGAERRAGAAAHGLGSRGRACARARPPRARRPRPGRLRRTLPRAALRRPAAAGGTGARAGRRPAPDADGRPFSAVDPIVRDRLRQDFLRLHRALPKTVLFVTHDVDEAIYWAIGSA